MEAGCDLNCGVTYLHLVHACQQRLVTEAQITEAAVRLFTTRILLGIFDGSEYDSVPYTVVECKEHRDLSERAARESAVLLKNNGILPLDREKIKTIGIIGPNADSRKALIGNYHGTSSEYITVLEGVRRLVGNEVRILYSDGCHLYENKTENLAREQDRLSEARIVARESDVVILCMGLDETLEGEEGDKHLEEYSDPNTDRGKKLRETICEKLHFTSLEYQSLDKLIEAIGLEPCKVCTYCWNGKE